MGSSLGCGAVGGWIVRAGNGVWSVKIKLNLKNNLESNGATDLKV